MIFEWSSATPVFPLIVGKVAHDTGTFFGGAAVNSVGVQDVDFLFPPLCSLIIPTVPAGNVGKNIPKPAKDLLILPRVLAFQFFHFFDAAVRLGQFLHPFASLHGPLFLDQVFVLPTLHLPQSPAQTQRI